MKTDYSPVRTLTTDVLTKGAILGGVMLLSSIFENAVYAYSMSSGLMTATYVESFLIMIFYVWFLYYSAKRFSRSALEIEGTGEFAFSRGLWYVIVVSMLAGIIATLGKYIFIHEVVGYDTYLNGYLSNLRNLILQEGSTSSYLSGLYAQVETSVKAAPEPTFFSTLLSGLSNYFLFGLIVGLFVAGAVKRKPNIFGDHGDDIV